jgi:hypothetical protein
VGPTIVIRADASSRIGTGHVMRCLALAASAKNQGWQISLIGCVASNEMQSRVADMGIHFIPLENACPDSVDLEKTLELLACHSENGESRPYPPWLVLDGYQFDANYHEAVRGAGVRMLVVDDYNHLNVMIVTFYLIKISAPSDWTIKPQLIQNIFLARDSLFCVLNFYPGKIKKQRFPKRPGAFWLPWAGPILITRRLKY